MINTDICEGCGDCSIKSNCLSVEPVETELGRKRRINQSTCNTDISCVQGFCPSFITITDGVFTAADRPRPQIDAGHLPLPDTPSLERTWNVLFTGVGGTGVTTVAAILAKAAHVDGNAATILDMTGLAQKGGPVLSHLRFARTPDMISTGRVPPASTDCLIACDLVVAAGADALTLMDKTTTRVWANRDVTPTSAFIRDRSKRFDSSLLAGRVKSSSAAFDEIDAEALSQLYFNDAIYTNMIMAGYAWQKGSLPISLRGIYRAIRLNGTNIDDNMGAFDLGRIAAHAPDRLLKTEDPRGEVRALSLDALIDDRARRLTDYQNAAYASQYRDLVARVRAAETEAGLGERLSMAVARFGYKVMAYKDEYEVARLWTDGAFDAYLSKRFKGGKIHYHLAPPVLARKDNNGHFEKKRFGAWMKVSFRLLKRFKFLRGTHLDPFGWTEERRAERALRDEYITTMGGLLDRLTDRNHDLAIQIAEIPDDIRGYGHVKEAAMDKAALARAELMAACQLGKKDTHKVSLIPSR